jgi:type 2 lantibiotic biosynthesis protein LanM
MSQGARADVTGIPPMSDLVRLAWRAATLGERLAVVRDDRAATDGDGGADLAAWAAAVAPSGGGAFERRLAWDAIDTRTARLALLELPPRSLPSGWEAMEWTTWMPRVRAALPGCREAMGTDSWARQLELLGSQPTVPFLEAWMPVLRVARAELEARLEDGLAGIVAPDALADLDRHLVRSLSAVGAASLFELFERSRAAEPAGCYEQFVTDLLDGWWASVVATYPAMARQLVRVAQDWVDGNVEMVARLKADRSSIESRFVAAAAEVRAIRPGLSDRHGGGRTVSMIAFQGGLRLAYKPRSVRLEAAFNDFLSWLRARGLDSLPSPVHVLDCGTHGWVGWVERAAFPSRDAVADYFRRAGGLACVVHLLGGTDLHGENLVASLDGPALIDTEMLLQPATGGTPPDGAEADEDARGRMAGSCLAPGLLSLVQIDADGRAYDIGGLQPSPTRTTTVGRREWVDPRADTLRPVTNRTIAPVLANDVRLDGVVQSPTSFAHEICEGFQRTHRFLAAHRDAVAAPDGPLQMFADCHVRILFRPSDQYGALQYLLAAPRHQRSGIDRSLAFERLLRVFATEHTRPRLWPLVAEEREALECLDIPRFTVSATATSITSASGEPVAGFLARSGLDAARERLAAIDDDGLRRHLCEVRAALQPAAVSPPGGTGPAGVGPAGGTGGLVEAAEVVGELVVGRGERSGRGLEWPSCGGALDLSGGASGVCLFLSALAALTGRERWREAAAAALSAIARGEALERSGRDAALGACRGAPSTAYALGAAARFLGDDKAFDLAVEALAGISPSAIDADAVLDVEGGCAGALMVLLAVHAGRADGRLLRLAGRCVARLLSAQIQAGPAAGAWLAGDDAQARPGFAHGAAGMACALERWLEYEQEPPVVAAIRSAWDYERRAFEGAGGSWPVTRRDGSRIVMAAWCHGAPGIALGRASGGGRAADAFIDSEIEATLALTMMAPRGRSDHLCCGNLGRADVLLTVGRITARAAIAERGRLLAEGVARQILEEGRLGVRGLGFDRGATVVGLLHGLSGIGYQLLRAAAPERVTSVLAFQALPGRDV